jgi:hypothetical protein
MGILTVGFSLHNSDVTPDGVNINFSGQRLTVEGPAVSQGGMTLTKGSTADPQTICEASATQSVFVYVINKSTSGGGIIQVDNGDGSTGMLARLNPGEWMFLPLEFSEKIRVAEIGNVHSADCEYAFFTRSV